MWFWLAWRRRIATSLKKNQKKRMGATGGFGLVRFNYFGDTFGAPGEFAAYQTIHLF